MFKRTLWVAMTVLAWLVGAYAAASLIVPAARQPIVVQILARVPWAGIGHLAGGMLAIVVGALQVNRRIRTRHLTLHRWLGRSYVVAVTAGGIAAFALATQSSGGVVAHFGFGLLAICWVGSTLTAYRSIKAGDELSHRAWMYRSYALTLAAVTLRIYLPIALARGVSFDVAYPTIAWMCWVPNLLIVEWFLLGKRVRVTATAS
jgi:uncharacterized membrane protein